MTDYHPTPHLLEKMNARDVTWANIIEVIEKPEVIYGPDAKGRRVMQKDNLSVVVAANDAVITVLLRDEEHWDDQKARNRRR